MIVLFQRTLAPYRVPLFNSIHDAVDGDFTLILTRNDPTPNRFWTIPWNEVRFHVVVLDGRRLNVGRGTLELSLGVRSVLDRLEPHAIVVAGWDVHACWMALRWARYRSVPVYGWVESSQSTGRWRGGLSNGFRRRFVASCRSAIVPGVAAEHFVHSLQPSLPCYHAPNSVEVPELRSLEPPPLNGAALYLGELSERKGADVLLRAGERLLSVFPQVVVAGDGPLRADFVAQSRRLRGFEYVGFVEGAARARCMQRASVVLLPSQRDPWPLAACEALVSRRPLVVGRGVGSLPDLLTLAGDAVVPMASQDVQSLVEAARRARRRVVPAGLRTAFTSEASADAMVAAIRQGGDTSYRDRAGFP